MHTRMHLCFTGAHGPRLMLSCCSCVLGHSWSLPSDLDRKTVFVFSYISTHGPGGSLRAQCWECLEMRDCDSNSFGW